MVSVPRATLYTRCLGWHVILYEEKHMINMSDRMEGSGEGAMNGSRRKYRTYNVSRDGTDEKLKSDDSIEAFKLEKRCYSFDFKL